MLLSNESQLMKDISAHYCLASFTTHALLILFLYFSDTYLLVGRREHLRVLAVFILLEIIKWLYYKILMERDIRITYKKKSLNLIYLFIKCFDFVHLLKTLIMTFVSSFLFYILAVLFGAEIFGKYEQTFMFSLHMSILTILPMYLNFGFSSLIYIISGLKPSNSLQQVMHRSFQGTVFGAWTGACVIPLDWDRPWQDWPIPCSFAALLLSSLSYIFIYLHMFFIPNQLSLLFKKK